MRQSIYDEFLTKNSAASWRSGVAGHLAAREIFNPLGEARLLTNPQIDASSAIVRKSMRIIINCLNMKQGKKICLENHDCKLKIDQLQ